MVTRPPSDDGCGSAAASTVARSALGRLERGVAIRAREHHRELLAAVASDEVHLAHGAAEERRDGPEHRVACRVADRLVVRAEPIHVDERHRHRVLEAAAALELLVEPGEQAAPVVRAGERVGLREPHHLLVEPRVRDRHRGEARDRLDEPPLVRADRRAARPPEREQRRAAPPPGAAAPSRSRGGRSSGRSASPSRPSSRPCTARTTRSPGRLLGEEDLERLEPELRAPTRSASSRSSGSSSSVDASRRPRSTRKERSRARRSASAFTASCALEGVHRERVLDAAGVQVGEGGERLVVGAGEPPDLVVALDRDAVQEVPRLRALHRGDEPLQRVADEQPDDEDERERHRRGEHDERDERDAVDGLDPGRDAGGLAPQPEHPRERRRASDGSPSASMSLRAMERRT